MSDSGVENPNPGNWEAGVTNKALFLKKSKKTKDDVIAGNE